MPWLRNQNAHIATHSEAVTPDDNADLPAVTEALLIEAGGDLAFLLENDSDATEIALSSVSANQIISGLRIRRVLATGTTATVRALY